MPQCHPWPPSFLRWGTGGLPGLSEAGSLEQGWCEHLTCTTATLSLLPGTVQLSCHRQRLALEVLWRVRWAGGREAPSCLASPWSSSAILSLGTSLLSGVPLMSPPKPCANWCCWWDSASLSLTHPPPPKIPPRGWGRDATTALASPASRRPCPWGGQWGVSRTFFSPLAQAGQLLGLSPNSVGAGPEPPTSPGQGEWGEGRRLEGRSSAGLVALGSERGGCSVWLLRASAAAPSPPPGRQGWTAGGRAES